ncbi:MAG: hypothetical protein GY800_03185 [Planctomycetes bacterium]|nr:hypothetical protein [Planctomycetota bacterium]
MSKRIKKYLEILKILKKATPEQRKALLKVADPDLILCLCECVDNILRGNIKLPKKKKDELAKYIKVLRKIQDRTIPKERKRALLVQNGGFLPALLAPIIAIAGSLIGDLVGNLVRK